jgi:transketolase
MAVGMAVAERNLADGKSKANRIYVVLSDGEVQEGSTWEAVLMATSLNLENLIAVIDNNDFQSLGRTSETHPSFYPLTDKFEAFGWEVMEVKGHDAGAIYHAITKRKGGRPFMLVAKTTKGRGVSYMENVPIWHYRAPNADEYRQALDELKEIAS